MSDIILHLANSDLNQLINHLPQSTRFWQKSEFWLAFCNIVMAGATIKIASQNHKITKENYENNNKIANENKILSEKKYNLDLFEKRWESLNIYIENMKVLLDANLYGEKFSLPELKQIITKHIDAILNDREKLQALMSINTRKEIIKLCNNIEQYKYYSESDLLDNIETQYIDDNNGKEIKYYHPPIEFSLCNDNLWKSLNEHEFKDIIEIDD